MAEILDDNLDFPFAEILDDFTIANYQLIKEKFQTQYIPYYTMMLQLNFDTSQGLGKMIVEALADINKALPLLDKVLSRKASRKELEILNKNITQIPQTQVKLATLFDASVKLARKTSRPKKRYIYYIGNFEWEEPAWVHFLMNMFIGCIVGAFILFILFVLLMFILARLYGDSGRDAAVAYYNLGVSCGDSGRYAEAVEACKKAIRINPDYAKAYHSLSFAYYKLGRYEEAIEASIQTIRIKPDYADAYKNLGSAYFQLGRWQEAIESYKQTIRIKPGDAEVYPYLGIAYLKLGRYEEAIEPFKQAIRIKPDDDKLHGFIAVAYFQLGRWQEAIEAYKQAIRIKPGDAEVCCSLGSAYFKLDRYEEATEAYKQAIRIKPGDAEAYNVWGGSLGYLAQKKKGKIRQQLLAEEKEKCLKAESIKTGAGAYNLSCVYALQGDKDNCRKWLKVGEQAGTLTTRKHAMTDTDLECVHNEEWFKQIRWSDDPK
jgi:tetratricopeptide (TPR) repeat protein